MKKYLLALCLIAISISIQAKPLSVVFEHNPPFQMINDSGFGYGPVYDFAQALVKQAGLSAQFTPKPWARIIEKDAQQPNTLILSISKTPQRSPQFIWLTSVYTGQQYIWKLRDEVDPEGKPVQVAIERDSHKMKSIYAYFQAENVLEVLNSTQALNALIKGRVQRFVGTTFAVSGKLASLGYSLNILEQLAVFNEGEFASQGLHLALTLGTEPEVLNALQQALIHPDTIKLQTELTHSFMQREQALLDAQMQKKLMVEH
ncbi:transporter substrate-binding domain-containing protein [Pseudoalteromonas tunicata]|uniref:substrate-binding periplasmic protein n=1 Tax=Pseudoalteromonas tunicata TaxID=314281 RepID=UPI00273F7A6E|nr:transporter substrate-binding domain-containing protein [Pseudoalteromonas tunicata]MDP5212301.1 transporter substrate-binding domain-containing protein [Pseudoalteromonas tunicata]